MGSAPKNKAISVVIITLYKALNHGAFLQAYALQKYLAGQGFDVCFKDFYDFRQDFLTLRAIKINKKNVIVSVFFGLKKILIFKKCHKLFKLKKKGSKRDDVAVLGSDEIWNINNPSFIPRCEFFGSGLDVDKIVAYAPSAANSTAPNILLHEKLVEGLGQIDCFSARDSNALDVIKGITGRGATRVLDPTFLADIEEEEFNVGYERYMVVYSYGLDLKYRDEVRCYAENQGLPIVSLGFYADWCHRSLNVNPFQFMNVLKKAECVITDTFHGTILSIQLRKKLAVYAKGKDKVKDFLSFYAMESRMVGLDNPLERVLDIKYGEELLLIDESIEDSKRYLYFSLLR
jgi:hypothetical protein